MGLIGLKPGIEGAIIQLEVLQKNLALIFIDFQRSIEELPWWLRW